MIRLSICLAGVCCALSSAAQTSQDTVKVLNDVIVKGYASDRPITEVSASIGVLNQSKLERFSNTSVLPAVNTIPGVRMEERSPGSYRFAIRGSSLRSPFGVRNVKIYWNGLPLTDGGGNTYLNLIDYNAIGNVEVIKGPGSSLYGAGTGGVVLLSSPSVTAKQIQVSALTGSYGLQRYQFAAQTGSSDFKIRFQYAHQQADGYRQQSAMRKDAGNLDVRLATSSRSTLSATLFYTDLAYDTPGALTKAEYDLDRQKARPDTKAFKGSVTQQAAISNKTVYGGVMYDYDWSASWSTKVGVYASHTDFVNPAVRNYEQRIENNLGGRTATQLKVIRDEWKGKLTLGGEVQLFKSPVSDYGNVAGRKDTLQFSDKLWSSQGVAFIQGEADLPGGMILTAGGSITFLKYRFQRISDITPVKETRNFSPVLSPRIALLKKITNDVSVFASASRGFSTPSLAEVRPSSNTYNNSLNPENGINYEIGTRGYVLQQKISFELTGYYFKLNKTIESPDGGDHFTNAGQTSQPGIEAGLGWNVINSPGAVVDNLRLWSTFSLTPYKFKSYVLGSADYSGNRLTGVPRDVFVSGLDFSISRSFYFNATFSHTGAISLQDASTSYAPSYYLLGSRAGYLISTAKSKLEIFGGVDNALNSRYSLGNDVNGQGGRYYNAAAPRNYYLGVKMAL